MPQTSVLVTVGPGRAPLLSLAYRGQLFSLREIKLNTSGMEFFNLEWANQSGTALICGRCTFVHIFAGDGFEVWDPAEGGYPVVSATEPG